MYGAIQHKVGFGLVLWNINNCRLFNTKSSLYTHIKCQSSVLECSSRVELHVKVNRLEYQAGKIICALGHSTMCWWSHPFPVW